MSALLIKNPSQIAAPRIGAIRSPEISELNIRTGDSIYVVDGVIDAIAPLAELENRAQADNAEILDASNRAVVPGFVDCHTHLIFGGNRADEFAMRTAGATYEESRPRAEASLEPSMQLVKRQNPS